METIVLDWFTTERDHDVGLLLMDHMVRQARHCGHYEALALEHYEKEPYGSSTQLRMAANAAGTQLYAKMRAIDAGSNYDLFRGGLNVTSNTLNISGGIQGGAISLGGSAENRGTTTIHYNPQTIEAIRSELSKAERELHSANIDAELKREALEHVQAAKADPAPDKISKVIAVLGKVESLAAKTAGIGTAIGTIVTMLGKVAGLM